MNERVTDIGWAALAKHGEELCGDHVVVEGLHGPSPVMVLADGLGSGVKACILATLTSKIIATMIAKAMPIEECVATIASTLPVCEVRKIAYATFTIIRVTQSREAEIIQYDNPGVILLRNGKYADFPSVTISVEEKSIRMSRILLEENDALVAVSDGALYAGTEETLNYAWNREAIIRYLEETHATRLAAKSVSTVLRDQCRRLYQGSPRDDTTASTVCVRRKSQVNVLIGPALNMRDDVGMLERFFSLPGKRIVCGGSTAKIAAAYLGASIKEGKTSPDPTIPPISHISGVDLVTEGALTIAKTAEYAADYCSGNTWYDDWCFGEDGASLTARLLLDDATHVVIFAGRAVNPAHRKHGLPPGIAAKLHEVEKLAASLEKTGKNVCVNFW